MPKKIVKYNAGWNPTANKGAITITYSDGKTSTWQGENPAEFTAMLQVLQGDDDPIVTDNGYLATGPEEPGGF